jgi:hypothetical protein
MSFKDQPSAQFWHPHPAPEWIWQGDQEAQVSQASSQPPTEQMWQGEGQSVVGTQPPDEAP